MPLVNRFLGVGASGGKDSPLARIHFGGSNRAAREASLPGMDRQGIKAITNAVAMLLIAALIGTTGLGQSIHLALGQVDVGLGVSAGAAMAVLAFIADRLAQCLAEERRRALGL